MEYGARCAFENCFISVKTHCFVEIYSKMTDVQPPQVDREESGSGLSDILKSSNPSPAKITTPPTAPPLPPDVNHDDLPGSVGSPSPFPEEERRPSTTLEVGPEGVAVMSDSKAPPSRLPPLQTSQDGDGLDGYRPNLDVTSQVSEVSLSKNIQKKPVIYRVFAKPQYLYETHTLYKYL
jgi:hypothetical protein